MTKEYKKIVRDWGYMDVFAENEKTTVKMMVLHPGERTSLQVHSKRDQLYIITGGQVDLTYSNLFFGDPINFGAIEETYKQGNLPLITSERIGSFRQFFFSRGQVHRVANRSKDREAFIFEIAFGENDEEDILRLEDEYGR